MTEIISSKKVVFGIFLAVVLILFGNTLSHEFVWDDKFLFGKKEFSDWENVSLIFSKADTISDDEVNPYYRPVTYLTFLWDYQMWKKNTFWYRLENVLLHTLAVFLFYVLVLRVFGDNRLAFISSLIFAVHPAVTAPVNFIAGGRNTMLCAAFSIGSLLLLTRAGVHGRKWVVFSLVAYFLALLSKEQAVTLPLFLLSLNIFSRKQDIKVNIYQLTAFFAVTGLYFILRMKILGTFTSEEEMASLYEHAGMVMSCLFEYFRIMLFPLNLSADYMTLPVPLFSYKSIAATAGLAVLVYISVKRKVDEPLRLAGIWLILTFLPISNIVPIPSSPVADRYMYLPLFGVCLASGYAIRVLTSKRPVLGISVLSVCIAALVLLSISRNNVWKDNIIFWEDVVRKSPDNSRGHYNLGVVYAEKGMTDKAIQELKIAIKLNPGLSKAYYDLGHIYQTDGFTDKAMQQYKMALRLNPDYAKVHYNLALIYQSRDLTEKALFHYQTVIKLDPDFLKAYYNLAVVYQSKGILAEAAENYRIVTELDPGNVKAHNNLGVVYHLTGQFDKAINQFKTAIEIQPENYEAYYNTGLAYRKKGVAKKAEEYFQKAEKYK
jgi:tetratricopeptide (TPR) repeat protein